MSIDENKKLCAKKLSLAFKDLHLECSDQQITDVSSAVIEAMSGQWRFFHTSEHIFDVSENGDAIEVIAAFFHDVVYYQVDGYLHINLAKLIAPFLLEKDGQLYLTNPPTSDKDTIFDLNLTIFDYQPGQMLNQFSGLNEFLSALVAGKMLENVMPISMIAEVIACIEASIPFRKINEDGKSSSENLASKLGIVNRDLAFKWSDSKLIEVVERSVRLSNRDVANFASLDCTDFLNHTWHLLPETNHTLGTPNYSVKGYRISIQKMEGFLKSLPYDIIFKTFHQEPSPEKLHQLNQLAKTNLEISQTYLSMKLVSIAILEALSLRIGNSVGLGTLLSEVPSDGFKFFDIEDYLPKHAANVVCNSELETKVLHLLEVGRTQNSAFDIKNSPVATYMLKMIGFAEMNRVLNHCRSYFSGQISSEDLLRQCDALMITNIVSGITDLTADKVSCLRTNI